MTGIDEKQAPLPEMALVYGIGRRTSAWNGSVRHIDHEGKPLCHTRYKSGKCYGGSYESDYGVPECKRCIKIWWQENSPSLTLPMFGEGTEGRGRASGEGTSTPAIKVRRFEYRQDPDVWPDLRRRRMLRVVKHGRVDRPVVRYHGGKFGPHGSVADWIGGHFPEHVCYVEPYGGAASVLLRKVPSCYEVYNDLDGDVVNFFQVLRERPHAFMAQVKLTPWSREEAKRASEETTRPVERARRFFVRAWLTRHGQGQGETGWRFQKSDNRQYVCEQWDNLDYLWAIVARLKHVQIENAEALAIIDRFDSPDTLFYVDPPYVASTRGRWATQAYQHEMALVDHWLLLDRLRHVRGMVVLSGYRNPLYDKALRDWERVEKETLADGATPRTECLWLSPRVSEKRRQLSLFETAVSG